MTIRSPRGPRNSRWAAAKTALGFGRALLLAFAVLLFGPDSLLAQSSPVPTVEPEASRSIEAATSTGETCTLTLRLEGVVGPATSDYLERGIKRAEERKCGSVLALINTPGGSLQTTRIIVEKILDSPVPVLCLVAPRGGHAGSAGAIILQACHIAGAVPATNIGAATPILGTGEKMPDDVRNKILEDTKSWVRGLTRLRGRNEQFGDDIIVKAKAVDADEALRLKAIDALSKDPESFLQFAQGRPVKMPGDRIEAARTGPIVPFEPDTRHNFLQLVTDPQFAYLLFMASLGLLYFELTHPGAIAPGVAGGIGLIVSLISFHKLEVWWGGVSLILLGLLLLIAEAFVPSFGALGVGGIIAFIAGSVLLYDPVATGYSLPLPLIITTAVSLGAMMGALAWFAFQVRKRRKHGAADELLEREGEVVSLDPASARKGMAMVRGETWRFVCDTDVNVGDGVVVTASQGLTLTVRKKSKGDGNG